MLKLSEYYKTIADNLKVKYPVNEAQAIARFYICETLNLNDIEFFTRSGEFLNDKESELLKSKEERLYNMEPVQYVTGYAYFSGLKFKVNPDVLIPRQETEILVNEVIKNHKTEKNLNIIDIGTGSGCIAVSLGKNLPDARVYGIDISENAIKTAGENARLNNTESDFYIYDIFSENDFPLRQKFDVIVSNPPYITESEKKNMSNNVLKYEPPKTLFVPDTNPLIYYDGIFKLSKKIGYRKLKIYFEINEKFGNKLSILANQHGFNRIEIIKDLNNKYRVVSCE